MPTGYRGHADWRDMSEYVVHFAKDVPDGKSAYDTMISILYSGKLEARTRFGAIRWSDALGDSQESACFSEIPLDRLDRLVQRRSRYGIGFHQDFLIESGGGRVWYLNDESRQAASIRKLIAQKVGPPMDVDSPLWDVTPFIDFPGSYGPFEYRFEWSESGGCRADWPSRQIKWLSCLYRRNFMPKRAGSSTRLRRVTQGRVIAVRSWIPSGRTSAFRRHWLNCRQWLGYRPPRIPCMVRTAL